MTNHERHQIIPAVFIILKRKNEMLLQRRYNSGFQDGFYTFPSGHVETGETPTMAAVREAKEETGVVINPLYLQFEQVLFRRGFNAKGDGFDVTQPERVDCFFSTEQWEGEPTITEPDKCDDIGWFSLDKLPENLFPIVKTFLNTYQNHTSYQESGY